MDTIKLTVHEREETGNGPARRLRAQGKIPGVTYAKGKTAAAISIDLEELKAAMTHGHNVILELDFGKPAKAESGSKSKQPRYAVVKQLQFHPVKRQLLHVDLHEVDLAQEIEAPVAIEPVGTPVGLADGGIMDWERREVSVRALPADMPSSIPLDVSGLLIGQHLSVAALEPPAGASILDDPEAVVLALVPPRVEQPAVEEVEAEAEEPEVVGEEEQAEEES